MSLKTQWTNPMASAVRFDTHLQTALNMASRVVMISGVDAPRPVPSPVIWLKPIVDGQTNSTESNDLDDDPDGSGESGFDEPSYSGDHVIDSISTLLDDYLEEDDDHSGRKTTPGALTTLSPTPALNLKWEAPVNDIPVTVYTVY